MSTKQIIQLSGAIVALFLAMGTSYFALAKSVEGKPSREEVRTMIEDKTADKYAEIIRRLEHTDRQIDRLETNVARIVRLPNVQKED